MICMYLCVYICTYEFAQGKGPRQTHMHDRIRDIYIYICIYIYIYTHTHIRDKHVTCMIVSGYLFTCIYK